MKLTTERVEEIAQMTYDNRVKRAGPRVCAIPWDLLGPGFCNDVRDAVRLMDYMLSSGNFGGPINALARIKAACWFEADEHFVDEVFTEIVPVATIGNSVKETSCFCGYCPEYTEDDFKHEGFKAVFREMGV